MRPDVNACCIFGSSMMDSTIHLPRLATVCSQCLCATDHGTQWRKSSFIDEERDSAADQSGGPGKCTISLLYTYIIKRPTIPTKKLFTLVKAGYVIKRAARFRTIVVRSCTDCSYSLSPDLR